MAEPRPYMNIKVAAFTVSEKSFNIEILCSPFDTRVCKSGHNAKYLRWKVIHIMLRLSLLSKNKMVEVRSL